ncbi:MAG TPA: hypothetical protein VH309_10435 [Elusimicrobiota bacterium]|nr:hypothetical protein [Elusimicrobiota bacterium]
MMMMMTIRSRMMKRLWISSIFYSAHLLAIAYLLRFPMEHARWRPLLSERGWVFWMYGWAGVSVLISIAWMIYVFRTMRCPRCEKVTTRWHKKNKGLKECGHCGLAFE